MEMSDLEKTTMEKYEDGDADSSLDDRPSSNISNNPDLTSSDGKDVIETLPANAQFDVGPPNGGLKAWLQVAGSFFLFFNTW